MAHIVSTDDPLEADATSQVDGDRSRIFCHQSRVNQAKAMDLLANPFSAEPGDISEVLSRQNDLYYSEGRMLTVLEATYDSHCLVVTNGAVARNAQAFQASLNKFDAADFGIKVCKWISSRIPPRDDAAYLDDDDDDDDEDETGQYDDDETMDVDPGPSTSNASSSASGSRRQLLVRMRGKAKPNIGRFLNKACWIEAGRQLEPILRRPPVFKFLCGAIDFNKTPAVKVKKERHRNATQEIAPVAKLKELDLNVQKDDEKTTAHVEYINLLLRRQYRQTGSPVDFWEFALNPSSFSKTVENLFHISFLFKEDRARAFRSADEDDTLFIEPIKKASTSAISVPSEQQQPQNRSRLGPQNNSVPPSNDSIRADQSNGLATSNHPRAEGAQGNQSIISITVDQWMELVDLYDLGGCEPKIGDMPSAAEMFRAKKRKKAREPLVAEENVD